MVFYLPNSAFQQGTSLAFTLQSAICSLLPCIDTLSCPLSVSPRRHQQPWGQGQGKDEHSRVRAKAAVATTTMAVAVAVARMKVAATLATTTMVAAARTKVAAGQSSGGGSDSGDNIRAAVVVQGGVLPCDDIFDCPLTPGGRQRHHFAGLMCTFICCSFPL